MKATQERGVHVINWNLEGDSTAVLRRRKIKALSCKRCRWKKRFAKFHAFFQQPATIVGGMMLGVSAIYELAPDVMHKVFQAMTLYPTESKLIALANMAIAGLAFLALRTSPGKMAGWIAFTAIAVTLIVIMEWSMLVS